MKKFRLGEGISTLLSYMTDVAHSDVLKWIIDMSLCTAVVIVTSGVLFIAPGLASVVP